MAAQSLSANDFKQFEYLDSTGFPSWRPWVRIPSPALFVNDLCVFAVVDCTLMQQYRSKALHNYLINKDADLMNASPHAGIQLGPPQPLKSIPGGDG